MNHRSTSTPADEPAECRDERGDRTYRTQRFSTPFGNMDVTINDHAIVASHYIMDPGTTDPDITDPAATSDMSEAQRHLFTQIGEQLDEYFSGTRQEFTLPLDVEDDPTEFTKSVREEMAQISPGDVLTYGELAEAVGRPRAARAVGSVCRTNPIQLFIPCHRVVAAGGSLGGYMGGARGLVLKQQLLEREGVPFTVNGKVDFQELGRRQETQFH
ncbi:methylated-DNA--[protein]-cysteine S-methyltransferase [Corynebacterium kroppenstedtii]|uniref:methylated-DNA--[protein]-cysteine S-methyltransferase n=1 Tax=Corynebacterium kroppenstedtii TaxID=161879 RepID=A0A2W5SX63_9CORY|nr:methylated-DNA--[protein]-cysteine S-methyltransferase [Corynebacterium kroppenstedtii]MDU7286550.1 methylated-DNA--[protein]-cysteine S-methyltransferase [Corynebacterium kroppenstedtii]PZR03935.1 MAG: methylated-DNA--[protein]-cysteine S-methyltransferase [Corynebacterium kroppenstedtii]